MPNRREVPYRLTQRPSLAPPISLPVNHTLDFSPPFCLAFTVSVPLTTATPTYLFTAMDPPFDDRPEAVVSSLTLSPTELTFTLGEASVTFGPPGGATSFVTLEREYVHLQICLSDSEAVFYANCERSAAQPFSSTQRIDGALLTFLQNTSLNGGGAFPVCAFCC